MIIFFLNSKSRSKLFLYNKKYYFKKKNYIIVNYRRKISEINKNKNFQDIQYFEKFVSIQTLTTLK